MLVQERLDIAVKWSFFRFLQTGIDPDSEQLYRWHIEKRTGGIEKRSWKKTVDDYIWACSNLLWCISRFGFDANYPIRTGKNGWLLDGAHRLACALLLELDVYYVIENRDGTAAWGESWFVRNKINPEDLEKIKRTWDNLKQSSS